MFGQVFPWTMNLLGQIFPWPMYFLGQVFPWAMYFLGQSMYLFGRIFPWTMNLSGQVFRWPTYLFGQVLPRTMNLLGHVFPWPMYLFGQAFPWAMYLLGQIFPWNELCIFLGRCFNEQCILNYVLKATKPSPNELVLPLNDFKWLLKLHLALRHAILFCIGILGRWVYKKLSIHLCGHEVSSILTRRRSVDLCGLFGVHFSFFILLHTYVLQ